MAYRCVCNVEGYVLVIPVHSYFNVPVKFESLSGTSHRRTWLNLISMQVSKNSPTIQLSAVNGDGKMTVKVASDQEPM